MKTKTAILLFSVSFAAGYWITIHNGNGSIENAAWLSVGLFAISGPLFLLLKPIINIFKSAKSSYAMVSSSAEEASGMSFWETNTLFSDDDHTSQSVLNSEEFLSHDSTNRFTDSSYSFMEGNSFHDSLK